ncbi:sigma-70 family RNA polymerase sigma factor [candidate division KSB1 bacterium]|nr:sigma-70 family RNA polymerase sigma factor [candidate division KSB1 bacterium]
MTDLTEKIIDAKRGDLGAFRVLVDSHQTFVYRVAYRLLSNKEDTEDAVQECFIRVWKNLSRFDLNKKFTTWLYRIITNLCYDRLRAVQRKENKFGFNKDLAQMEDRINPDTQFHKKDMMELITKLADHLPPKQKIVFVLRDLEDRDIKTVAAILKMTHKSVKSNLYYARKYLRTKLSELNSEL